MLRIIYLAILPGMVFSACTAWVFADHTRHAHRVAVENKPIYSNRPAGYTVPAAYYGTPMAPRFYVPPVARYRPVTTTPIEDRTAGNVFDVAHDLPSRQTSETIYILREPQPEVSVDDELDSFHARLAKIHVEKRQLPEALKLIQKIKSETFKVRTVVSLAEYVSRDKAYQSEADQLFGLALAGMEALDRGQPFRIESGSVRASVISPPVAPPVDPPVTPPVDPPVKPDTPQRLPFLIEEDMGRNGRLPPPMPPKGNGVDGGIVDVGSPPESHQVAPPARIPKDDEDDGPAPPDHTPNDEPTPPDSSQTPSPAPIKPPPIPLDDPTSEKPTSPPVEPRTEEPKPTKQPTTRRPPRIILDED